jgi:hypothetical protein
MGLGLSDPVDLSPENLTFNLDSNSREAILDLVLAWGRYDGLISQWLLHAFGLSLDSGSILLGNMDTRTKLDRLKGLYQHHGMKSAVANIAKLQKAHLEYVDIRNLIAHSGCAGQVKSHPWMVAFAPVKTTKGLLDTMIIEAVSVTRMHNAERWAQETSDALFTFIQMCQPRSAPLPPEPPVFPGVIHSNPQNLSERKRGQPRARKRR